MSNTMKSISQILNEILGGLDPICSVREIAGICGVTERTVSNWRNVDGTEPTYTNVKTLSHYLINEYQYYILAFQFMIPSNGRANGDVQDDLMAIYEAGTDVHRAFRNGDKQAYEQALARMKAEIRDLQAEGQKYL